MVQRIALYIALVFSLAFASCQKQDVVGRHDYKTLGSSAHSILVASPYSVLKIEIQYMPGFAPDSGSVSNLINFLNDHINKPGGIQIVQNEIASSGKPVLSIDEIVSIEKNNRTVFTENNVLAVHILITDGAYNKPNTLATSYWNTSFCVFGKTMNDDLGVFGFRDKTNLLTTLFEHEFGHLLGLVNQGTAMQSNHSDPSNAAHCNNRNCLMYYDIEISAIGGIFSVPKLDSNCEEDLRANGGK